MFLISNALWKQPKKSKLRASHVHLERQPALSVLTALTLCFSSWFKVDLMSGIKKKKIQLKLM